MKRHGVDLDRTLATYDEWEGSDAIGEPIPLMAERVRGWLAVGDQIDIFTARMHPSHGPEDNLKSQEAVLRWFLDVFGVPLPGIVTCEKDPHWDDIWDDKVIQVVPNTGIRVDGVKDLPAPDSIGDFICGED